MKHKAYWDSYYKNSGAHHAPPIPSQFSAFFLMELPQGRPTIVEFGCGNGRDSMFFSKFGHRVIGVDSSTEAINHCRNNASDSGAEFIQGSVSDDEIIGAIQEKISTSKTDGVCIYARFFLHAISEEEQLKFLRLSKNLIKKDGILALEFRTMRDKSQEKVTPDHYRRFINPLDFMHDAGREGFKTHYFTEGFGMAKYKNDDAHVARFILKPDQA